LTIFIIIAALITLLALGLLIWPLKRTRNTISYERHAQNIHYAKERMAELDSQLKNAAISATDYEALKLEIESTLAQDIDMANQDQQTQQEQPRRSNKFAISLLGIFLPVSALGVYLLVGTPDAINTKGEQRPTHLSGVGKIRRSETRLQTCTRTRRRIRRNLCCARRCDRFKSRWRSHARSNTIRNESART